MTASNPPIKKSLYRIITVITIICLLVISCTIPASAYSNEQFPNDNWFPRVNLPCSRPQLTDGCVYAEVLTKQGSTFYVDLIVINVSTYVGKDFDVIAEYDNLNSLTFYINYNEQILDSITNDIDIINPQCTVYRYSSLDGKLKFSRYYHFTSTTDNSVSFEYTYSYSIYGVHYYGMNFTNQAIPDFQVEFVVTYASEGLVLNYLDYLKNAIINFHGVTTTQLTTITDLLKEFVNGPSDDNYVPPAEESPPRDDSTVDDIKDKEKEALGGKSDEEIQQGVSNSLNLDNMKGQVNGTDINENGILAVQSVFNQIFTVMGGAWSTFFILTLTVAFAAFLIGRNY